MAEDEHPYFRLSTEKLLFTYGWLHGQVLRLAHLEDSSAHAAEYIAACRHQGEIARAALARRLPPEPLGPALETARRAHAPLPGERSLLIRLT
ncbi:hypothetical protein [Falsiroseomonas sp. CW058]|uniref:hypothetical protein n=1 Tax=Falsiroseomonas sp. CW058 TaxID=3388664 RepID=UPI003D318A8D